MYLKALLNKMYVDYYDVNIYYYSRYLVNMQENDVIFG